MIETLVKHAKKIADGKHEQVKPGMPFRLSEAAVAGDIVWQGDLGLEVVDAIPDGYRRVAKPKAADRQLVIGNTQGARHCLASLAGVELYRPKNWTDESLEGPAFVALRECEVLHPTHGKVIVAAGLTIHCHYQREWDKEQARARRVAD